MSFKRYEVTLPPITVGFQNLDYLQAFDDQPSSGEESLETTEADARKGAPIGTESWNEGLYNESRIVNEVGTDPELPFFVWGTLTAINLP